MAYYTHTDKRNGDGLAITDWNNASSALAGSSGLTLACTNPADRIGIGTNQPMAKLDLRGDLALGAQAGGGAKLLLTNDDKARFIRAKDSWMEFVSHPNEGWKFISSDGATTNERLRVTSGGNVGIGTNAPQAPLSIGAANGKENNPDGSMHITNGCILFGGNNSGKEASSASISAGKHEANSLCIMGMGQTAPERKVTIWAEGGLKVNGNVTATRFVGDGSGLTNLSVGLTGISLATTSGNVGIGTTGPTEKLDVAGAMKLRGEWQKAYSTHSRLYFNDTNFGIGCGRMDDTAPNDDLYIFAYGGPDRDIRFMHTTNGKTDTNTTAWTTDMIIKHGSKVGIGTVDAQAPLTISGDGKESSPDVNMHITNDCILFGGNNSGCQADSAQISAAKHDAGALCIVGMGQTQQERKVTIWAEAGLKINGLLFEKLEYIDCLGRDDWGNTNHPIPQYFIAKLRDKPTGTTLKAFGKLNAGERVWGQDGYFLGYRDQDGKVVVMFMKNDGWGRHPV